MSHFDNLPTRAKSHVIDDMAIAAFRKRLLESDAFILQSTDQRDYGVDCNIEVVDQGQATNIRLCVQLKGTERALRSNGAISVEVDRTNLNYLLMQPYSFYVCYHVPTDSLRICYAQAVLRLYEHDRKNDHGQKNWTEQEALSVPFSELLTVERLRKIATLSKADARIARNKRVGQASAKYSDVHGLLKNEVADVNVPENHDVAAKIISSLYDRGADEIISAAFDKFSAVLGADSDAMGYGYMAEINLGMVGYTKTLSRVEAAIAYFSSRLDAGAYQRGSLHYTIGNAWSALKNEEKSKEAYEQALKDPAFMATPELAAQVYKNLGSSIERLGNRELASSYYLKSLDLNSGLPEAHFALGNYYTWIGQYQNAIDHLDRAIFINRASSTTASVSGWRINALFNLEDGRSAFREINNLLTHFSDESWVWSWCAVQVASFGRTSTENARQAMVFWQRYVATHSKSSAARRELLLAGFYLRSEGQNLQQSYEDFRKHFDEHIDCISDDDAALPWDRLGHLAQDEDNWIEAERCFRKAFEIEGSHYGYCLGTALNFLGRYKESLPILLEQATSIQPDAMSWFQVAVAREHLGEPVEAITAYERAMTLDPSYGSAMFNLGGVHWNSGNHTEAAQIWRRAIDRFPDHEASIRLQSEMPFCLAIASLY